MIADFDLIPVVNVLFCVIILIFGLIRHSRNQDSVALLVGIAFGIFGVSHFLAMLATKGPALEAVLIVIRAIAYLTIVVALCKKSFKEPD